MKRHLLVLVVFALVVAACGEGDIVATSTSTTLAERETPASALAAARNLWNATAPADYTVELTDDVGQAQTVAVRGGESITLSPDAAPVTVADVFETIERSIGDGAVVEVDYHPDFGYPTRVVIDLDGDGSRDIDLTFADLEAMPIVQSLAELLESKQVWDSQELDNYRFIFRADCTCDDGGTWDVAVRHGDDVSSEPLDEAARTSQLSMTGIDRAFTDLEAWFTDSEQFAEEGLVAVDVRMDPERGYPRWFRVEGEGIGDDNFVERFELIVTIDLIGPIDPGEPKDPQANEADVVAFVAAFERLERFRVRDYSFVVTRHCECDPATSGPTEVVVTSDNFASATLVAAGIPVAPENLPFETLHEAMQTISLYLNTGKDVEVTYHPSLGYPLNAILDTEAVAVDGGLAFTISEVQPTDTGVVAGRVVAGPQCPVQTDPPTPGCEDQPVANAVISMGESEWAELIAVPVAADGTFALRVGAGSYVIAAEPVDGYMGTPEPIEFDIVVGEILDLVIMYDTGIR